MNTLLGEFPLTVLTKALGGFQAVLQVVRLRHAHPKASAFENCEPHPTLISTGTCQPCVQKMSTILNCLRVNFWHLQMERWNPRFPGVSSSPQYVTSFIVRTPGKVCLKFFSVIQESPLICRSFQNTNVGDPP